MTRAHPKAWKPPRTVLDRYRAGSAHFVRLECGHRVRVPRDDRQEHVPCPYCARETRHDGLAGSTYRIRRRLRLHAS